MQVRDRLIVALDRSSREEVMRLVDALSGVVGMFKIGLQAFVANGPLIVEEIVARGEKVFLDLKVHDIPNTASHAVAEAVTLGASMVTVHASGGEEMLRACAREDAIVLGVTVLTSLDDDALYRIGFRDNASDAAAHLSLLSKKSGLRGVVASPHEIPAIRKACGSELLIVTPGIRPNGSDSQDQRRTTTPAAAIAAGADFIVIGRPITASRNPRAAALAISETLSAVG